jgi:integrase/recombinase XerD
VLAVGNEVTGRINLSFATDELKLMGRSYEGFPLLYHDNGEPVEPFQTFLWKELTEGKLLTPDSWAVYGRATYDFCGFLEANGIDWRAPPQPGKQAAILRYRHWALGHLERNTYNTRVRFIHRFFRWALEQGALEDLPYRRRQLGSGGEPLPFEDETDLPVRTWNDIVRFVTETERVQCRIALTNETHRLMFRLMEETGLRQCECRSFPKKYVREPPRGMPPRRRLIVPLLAKDMHLKYGRERNIEVPCDLMTDLYWYAATRRKARTGGHDSDVLFLTQQGKPYSASGLQDVFVSLSNRVALYVRPHMLRASYAVDMLLLLRRSKTFKGDPLLHVSRCLGHSSVTSTMRYLRAVEMLEANDAIEYEEHLDRLAEEMQ